VLLSLLAGESSASSAAELPIQRVVKLIAELKAKTETDGKNEQKSFDEYACWCENTLERKSAEISSARELIADTETLIKKLKGEIASHGAEIKQLNKDIAQNVASAKDAAGARDKEYKEYAKERSDSENCIGALEYAIKTLTGAGTKKGFLDTSHQVQLLSMAGQVQRVLRLSSKMQRAMSANDLEIVRNFVAKPMEFFQSKGMVAAQVGQNPFGDYAPQSSQIQGILQGMYDAFTADLEKDNAAEAESQKSFEALMATKKTEKETLVATLRKQEGDSAEKTKHLSESQVLLDDTTTQLEADVAFFADTKEACQAKATEWSVRTRLRTEELNGMATAMQILTSGAAKKTLKASANTFVQLSSVQRHQTSSAGAAKAYGLLRNLAARYKSMAVARIALSAQSGGHFDKVISQIDMMVADLRKEEAEDIAHRDLCENQQNANKNELADLQASIQKTEKALGRMENTKKALEGEIAALDSDITATEKNMADTLKMRNKESKEFKQALKDDADAIALMKQAIEALTKFYKDNNLALELAQKPEYTKDPNKAPSTWSGDYGGRKSESTGILAILAMLVEDTEKEMAEGRADDADAQAKFEEVTGALQKTLDAQEETKANTEREKGDLEEKMAAYEKFKNGKADDQDAEGDTNKALATECEWVKTHFDSRREKRKTEIQGLVDAKAFLSGSSELP
jgi:predicted  nucleic acid-binding Zn-ribbon protein